MQLDAQSIIAAVGVKLAEERGHRMALQDRLDELTRIPGPAGERGVPGERGATGSEGPVGLQGEPGSPGTPAELTAVPDDIAEQVSKAIAVLKESSAPAPRAIVLNVNSRDVGKGERGERGVPGEPGRDGADGIKGDDGPPGRDGISVAGAAINRDGELMLTLSNGTVLTPGRVQGRDA